MALGFRQKQKARKLLLLYPDNIKTILMRQPKTDLEIPHINTLIHFVAFQFRAMLGPVKSINRQVIYQIHNKDAVYVGRSQDVRNSRKWGGPVHRLREHFVGTFKHRFGIAPKTKLRSRYQQMSQYEGYPLCGIL